MSARPIYLDNAATTCPDPRVVEAMLPWLRDRFGNASSLHEAGRAAHAALGEARRQVAELLNTLPDEVLFTASGTESDNLALFGIFGPAGERGGHLAISAFEHAAVAEPARRLEERGVGVTRVPVGADGLVDPDDLARAIRPDTRLVSIMTASNIAGTLQPIEELAAVARSRGVPFHTDAVQATGKVPLDLQRVPIDLLSLSAHKFHGPPGVGALVVRRGTGLVPLLHGGGQEQGLRPATENVAGIVGLGVAADIARREMPDDAARIVGLRDRLLEGLEATLPGTRLVGHRWRRLPGHLPLIFDGQEGEAIRLLLDLDAEGIFLSSGSACSSARAGQPSRALLAMGYDPIRARGLVRISLGRFNTSEEIDRLLEIIPARVRNLRPTVTRPNHHMERSAR